jgi:hypothetical protein
MLQKSLPFWFYGGFALENAGPLDQLYKVGSCNKPESAFYKITHKWCMLKHKVGNSRGTSGLTTT